MKKILVILVLAVFVLGLAVLGGCGGNKSESQKSDSSSESKAKSKLSLAAGAMGSTTYNIAAAMATIAKKYSDLQVDVVPTGGSSEAMTLMGKGEADFAFMDTGMMAAVLIKGDPKKLYITEKEFNNTRGLFRYDFGGMMALVRADSGIKTMEELRGKRISIGAPGSVAAQRAADYLSAHEGDYKKLSMLMENAVEAMKDKKLDAMMMLINGPSAQTLDLDAAHAVYLIPATEAGVAEMNKRFPGTYAKGNWPVGTFPSKLNNEPVLGVFVSQYFGANKNSDPKAVEALLDVLFSHMDEFYKMCPHGKGINLESVLKSDIPIPIHQGAYDYYKGKGIEIPKHNTPVQGDFYKKS